ncbi:MAG: hypothetical protein QM621_13235 [Aeromicrobium sp.]|uniref:phosphatase domain-containing protein n=1 Tax=Aeromicrobium sp. TaxID=1871063 RepID=UPI0039E4EFC2
MSRDAVIFDLDGTLCDTSGVEHLVHGDGRDFAAFQRAAVGCPPNEEVVEAAREQARRGRAVLIVSSREFVWLDHTLDWLVEHEIPYEAVYLRVVGDYRRDVEVKRELLADVVEDGFQVVEAWDDKERVVRMWREEGIEAHEVGC